MTQDVHERAREWIVCSEDLSGQQQAWLQSHLEGCSSCREYAEAAEQLVRSLRVLPVVAGRSLVMRTQMRVRSRARELRQTRERLALVTISCALVAVSSAVTTGFVWRGFEWLGRWEQLSNPVWQAGFVLFWMAPTIAASILLLAHGTHLSSNGASRG